MKKDLNKHLLDFLRIWKEEVESGNPRLGFKRDGICSNFQNYVNLYAKPSFGCYAYEFLEEEYFKGNSLPFNGKISYFKEGRNHERHLNYHRVQWVNKTIIKLEQKRSFTKFLKNIFK